MNRQILQSDLPKPKRPLILTFVCIWYLFLFSWQLIELLIPSGYAVAIEKLPTWFVLSQLIVLYPVGIVSMIGVWQMRKWGLYLFGMTLLFSTAIMYYGLHLLPNPKALLSLSVFFVVALIYFKRMR
jgi:hypothetical protein